MNERKIAAWNGKKKSKHGTANHNGSHKIDEHAKNKPFEEFSMLAAMLNATILSALT